MKIAISGSSGKTGLRIAEEALSAGYKTRLLVRKESVLPESLQKNETKTISLFNSESIDQAIDGCDALIIATGARPSIDLTGPLRVDALGVRNQVESCERMGVKRLILVSSLCTGRWIHPLNLFGLILVWKRVGERALESSSLDWTVIRPGGLNEREDNLDNEFIRYSSADIQQDAYIPRRLVARSCIEALRAQNSIGKIIEITSDLSNPKITMSKAIENFVP